MGRYDLITDLFSHHWQSVNLSGYSQPPDNKLLLTLDDLYLSAAHLKDDVIVRYYNNIVY